MTTDAATTDRKREDAVLQRVVDMVEPLTGFTRAQFEDVSSTTERVVVSARQHFRVGFHIAPESGVGRLPRDSEEVPDSSAAWKRVNAQKMEEQSALPYRLEEWVAEHGDWWSVSLDEGDCMEFHAPVGYEGYCASCNGKGAVTCGTCNGKRQFTCSNCNGDGNRICSNCQNGRTSCSQCNGRGSWTEYRTRNVTRTDAYGEQEYTTEQYTEYVTCNWCSGSGTQMCTWCSGLGRTTCNVCYGSGITTCATCNGNGSLRCQPCGATGWLHEQFQLRVTVHEQLNFTAATDNAEARRTLEGLNGFPAYGDLMQKITSGFRVARDSTIERAFSGEVEVTTLSLSIVGTTYEIVAYGSPPKIFDYKNIVSQLLKGNLDELETALRRSPRFLPWMSPRLNVALNTFLHDEANQQIAKRAAAAPNQIDRIAESEFRQAISKEYVRRALTALRGSMERIYWSGTPYLLPFLLLAPIVLLVMGELQKKIHFGPIPAVVVGLTVIAIGIALELLGKWRVKQRFGAAFGDSLNGLLSHYGILRRGAKWIRWMAIGGALLGWIGGAVTLATMETIRNETRLAERKAKERAALLQRALNPPASKSKKTSGKKPAPKKAQPRQ